MLADISPLIREPSSLKECPLSFTCRRAAESCPIEVVGQYSIAILNLLKSDAGCGYNNVEGFLWICAHAAGVPPELFHRGGHMKATKNTGVEHQKQSSAGAQQRGGADDGKL